ncbi:phosphoglycolate phosphatase [Planomicrobium stackebrandtii]|uniref:Phosphoglycolate phosphatase n=1 Tax=Planomicrobium stackebrandtii TaxID=253160 RepID=A0ABU0GTV7_9BACL|nr:HAD family hydrolase [Planomicrobium stackebrandtii]MDQ0428795.1 phosphoglycolate phosphatase [Planomicrobium stackebrandtii]
MDSIIFDLDGTLWDSTAVVGEAWNSVLKAEKVQTELSQDDVKGVMGLQQKEIGQKLLPDLSGEEQQALLKQFSKVECQYLSARGGQLFDGVEEVLKELSKKYKLYIVSNCQEGYIESFYAYHELDKHFLDFENPGRTGLTKGENIKLIMERNKLKNPVYIGDTEGDHQAAKFAGIPFVYAAYGFGEVSGFDHSIGKFGDLLGIFG